MKAVTLTIATLLGAVATPTAVHACGYVLSPRLPGETDVQLADRTRRAHQDELRSRATSVFLAQVSAARMTSRTDAEYTLTPFFPLYDTTPPEQAVTLHDSPVSTACEVEPELGHIYVVYAEQQAAGWRVIEIVRHDNLQDPPPGMPTARDVARGIYAPPAPAPSGAALLAMADLSFSSIPFGSRSPPEGLIVVDREQCETDGECSWRDSDSVEHYYWDGELVVKTVTVAHLGDQPIGALGIGTARTLDDVVRNVRAFLPEAGITCQQSGAGHDCGAGLGEGWFRLFFDASGRLTEARLDAYHFT